MRTVLFIILLALVVGCDSMSPSDEGGIIRELTTTEAKVVESDNRFGLNLFRAVSAADSDENVFISPLSVSLALGMTLNGADGETYRAMRETLELNGLDETQINEAFRGLIDLLENLEPDVVFEIANSIWYREGEPIEEVFLQTNREYFDSEVRGMDFRSPDAVNIINGWVDEKTHGKIETILDVIPGNVVMYLINAIYFNGTWTNEFDAKETKDGPFTNADGTETTVRMMEQPADLGYFETDQVQAVDLPYGDSLYSMSIILPKGDTDLNALVADLDDSCRSFCSTDKRDRAHRHARTNPRGHHALSPPLNSCRNGSGQRIWAADPIRS